MGHDVSFHHDVEWGGGYRNPSRFLCLDSGEYFRSIRVGQHGLTLADTAGRLRSLG